MNTTTKTVEQLKEELRIAQEAVAEQERIVREQERAAKHAVERAKHDEEELKIKTTMLAALQPVYAALQVAGVKCEVRGASIKTGAKDYSPDTLISVEREERSHSGYAFRSDYTGRLTIIIGDRYQNMPKLRYPQLKTGGHNVEKIVKTIQERLVTIDAAAKRAVEKKVQAMSAEQLAAQVRIDNGYKIDDNYSLVRSRVEYSYPKGGGRSEYHHSDASTGKVYFVLGNYECTPEEAKLLLDVLKQIEAARLSKERGQS